MTAASHWSVRTFVIWLVLACLLPGVIVAAVLFNYEYREGRAQLKKSRLQTTHALVQAVDNHLLKIQAVAQALAASDALARHDLRRFYGQARDLVALAGLGTNVVLRDADGRQVLNTVVEFGKPLPRGAVKEQVRKVFSTGKPFISDVFIGPVLKQPIMSVDVPVIIDGKVVYALAVGILPEQFNALLKEQDLPPDWVAAVLDNAGTVVARTRRPELYVGHKASSSLRASLAHSREGSLEVRTLEGDPVLSFFSRSPVTNWTVAIGIPSDAVEDAFMRGLYLLAAGVAALFVIGLALARFMGGRIAKSVKALTAPAAALGSGEAVPVPRVHIREAAEVASAIGRAAALLQERAAALQAREAELNEAHRLARLGTWFWNVKTGEMSVSASVRDICGSEVPPFPEQKGTLLSAASWEQMHAAAQEVLRTGKGYDLELQLNHGAGYPIWVNAKCDAVRDARGKIAALRGTIQDITERKLAEQRIRAAALHDAMTGLPNRALVFEFCGHLLAAAQRNHSRGALLFIDLDRFKPINDLHGHETGDRVLQEVGKRLVACTRHEDLVGRLGGDEFVIVLPYLDNERHRAATVARHVLGSISQPFHINGLELCISPSIGISYFPEHAGDVGTLIHTADLAMYQAKQSGRANYQFYTPELDLRADQALSLETRLRDALRHGGLSLHYQPVIDIRSGRLIGAEALVRMTDNDGTLVGPERFIPVAESAGLIGELGEWVAVAACRQQEAWLKQGIRIMVAINVSPLQFRQRAFAERLGGIIAEAGIDPGCIEIEVTESTIMESVEDAIAILNRIKSLGVKVALDDFGTGYSSLSSLGSLPLDKLKVDQSFVRRIERDAPSRAITDAIIALGRRLALEVVGEGIESEHALHYLREQGCTQAQGFWFSRPLPPQEFAQWCRNQPARGEATTVKPA